MKYAIALLLTFALSVLGACQYDANDEPGDEPDSSSDDDDGGGAGTGDDDSVRDDDSFGDDDHVPGGNPTEDDDIQYDDDDDGPGVEPTPDPYACNTDGDCFIGMDYSDCCNCPAAYSRAAAEQNQCIRPLESSYIPEECIPEDCEVDCSCAVPDGAWSAACEEGMCVLEVSDPGVPEEPFACRSDRDCVIAAPLDDCCQCPWSYNRGWVEEQACFAEWPVDWNEIGDGCYPRDCDQDWCECAGGDGMVPFCNDGMCEAEWRTEPPPPDPGIGPNPMECAAVDCGMPDCQDGYTAVLPAGECCMACVPAGECAEGNELLRREYENAPSEIFQCYVDSDCIVTDLYTGCWTSCAFAFNGMYAGEFNAMVEELDRRYCSGCEMSPMACPDVEYQPRCANGWCIAY